MSPKGPKSPPEVSLDVRKVLAAPQEDLEVPSEAPLEVPDVTWRSWQPPWRPQKPPGGP